MIEVSTNRIKIKQKQCFSLCIPSDEALRMHRRELTILTPMARSSTYPARSPYACLNPLCESYFSGRR